MSSSSTEIHLRSLGHRRGKLGRPFPRTRTGCLACRLRKKKCDEVKPKFQACTRNKLDCSWPLPILERFFRSGHDVQLCLPRIHEQESISRANPDKSLPLCESKLVASQRRAEGECAQEDSKRETVVRWSSQPKAFLSPRRIPLSQVSQMLLSHYLGNTGLLISPMPPSHTPFISCLVPLSYNDDMLMHSILALSGSHLSYKLNGNIEIQVATGKHYSLALRSLHVVMENRALLHDPLVKVRMILSIMILCYYEVVSGNQSGSLFMHLRASRYLILQLQGHNFRVHNDRFLYGLIIEIYAYIVFSNSITPFGMNQTRTMIYDPFLQSLDDLRQYGAFGSLLNGLHFLFQIIPQISLFAAGQKTSNNSSYDLDRLTTYNDLKRLIINRSQSFVIPQHDDASSQRTTLEIYSYALLIFLETALSPITVHGVARKRDLQLYIDAAITHMHELSASYHASILLWPLLIVGSCTGATGQRSYLKNMLDHNHFHMKNTGQAGRLLELLWAEDNEDAVGPYGLGLVMDKYGLNYGVL